MVEEPHQPTEIAIRVDAGAGADAEELAELTSRLRDELLELDPIAVRSVPAGPPPAGAKGAEALEWGKLAVTVLGAGSLPALVAAVRDWLGRGDRRGVTLTIGDDQLELTGVSSDEQQRIAQAWLDRHPAD
jgi:hypothetical protein